MSTDTERRILKYHVPIGGEHTIELSIFGDIVHVGQQPYNRHEVTFWAMHSPRNVQTKYTFRVFRTGEPVPSGWKHMGSVVDQDNGFVWHLFVQGVECRRLP